MPASVLAVKLARAPTPRSEFQEKKSDLTCESAFWILSFLRLCLASLATTKSTKCQPAEAQQDQRSRLRSPHCIARRIDNRQGPRTEMVDAWIYGDGAVGIHGEKPRSDKFNRFGPAPRGNVVCGSHVAQRSNLHGIKRVAATVVGS